MRPLPSLEQFVEKDGHTLHALGRAAPCQISILRVGSSGPNGELSSIVYGEDMVVFARKFISLAGFQQARTTHPAGEDHASCGRRPRLLAVRARTLAEPFLRTGQ